MRNYQTKTIDISAPPPNILNLGSPREDRSTDLKHETHRLRPVYSGTQCIGHLLYGIRGCTAFYASDVPRGTYERIDAAGSRFRTCQPDLEAPDAP
jgi:hypothetical protein